jgi:hypothetical protein
MYYMRQARLGTLTIPLKIAEIRLSKNAPKKFPDYLRYTTAGDRENEDYQTTT